MFLFLLAGICANIFVFVCFLLFGIHTWRHIGPTLWATSCFVRVPIKRTAYFRWFIFLLLGSEPKVCFFCFLFGLHTWRGSEEFQSNYPQPNRVSQEFQSNYPQPNRVSEEFRSNYHEPNLYPRLRSGGRAIVRTYIAVCYVLFSFFQYIW